ncbi:MAG: NAD(P)/FAD-dependent oxidoreductase [Pseudomonadales bacterium]
MRYPDTYYAASAIEAPERATLPGDVSADVCIVGAGIAGLSCALELLEQGKKVILLEREAVGWGASGRNGGLVSPGWAQGLDALEKKVGLPHTQALYRLSEQGVEQIERNIARFDLQGCDLRYGQLRAARFPQAAELKANIAKMQRDYQVELDFLEVDEVRQVCKTERYFEGILNRRAFHFHPLNYCLGLAAQIEALGGQIFERSGVTEVIEQSGQQRVVTATGSVQCRDVVFCGGGYTGPEIKPLYRAFLPISTYVVLTEPLGDLAHELISQRYSICDDRRAADYYRLVEDDRILWGSRITTKNEDQVDKLAAILREDIRSVYPVLADVKIERAWSGLMSYAGHRMPIVGRQRPGIWLCSAFGGHGLNSGSAAGTAVAQGICDINNDYQLFEPFGCQWNGGIFGPLAASITYSYLRMKDRRQEAV